jgi:hypothetical protein
MFVHERRIGPASEACICESAWDPAPIGVPNPLILLLLAGQSWALVKSPVHPLPGVY